MIRFILLSFGFLGWAFYEMSGGASFDAGAVREARLAAAAAEEQAKTRKAAKAPVSQAIAEAPKVFVDTDPPLSNDVTRVALNLTTLEQPRPAVEKLSDSGQNPAPAVPQNISIVTSSADTPAIIPSLINPGETQQAVVQSGSSAAYDDIRTVSGNRVNVRGGPGTDYGVVTKLERGDAVKILESDGNGWVRLEPLDGGPGGWMAEFLLDG